MDVRRYLPRYSTRPCLVTGESNGRVVGPILQGLPTQMGPHPLWTMKGLGDEVQDPVTSRVDDRLD